MRFLNCTLETPAQDLALDEWLLLQAEKTAAGECLRVWERPIPAVILGSGCRLVEEVNEQNCLADSVPILRRSSGGGTVVLGPGCLLFSLILDAEAREELGSIRGSYCVIMQSLVRALPLPGLSHDGISDLELEGRKVSGNSQQRKRRFLLHHGTLLYRLDPGLAQKYLLHPPREPSYRKGRDHGEFLGNLPLEKGQLVGKLQEEWQALESAPEWNRDEVIYLAKEKYALESWTRRR
ncbi:MAG: lipoate--protein ligase family protein [Gemmataceae bacterium]|nr:lipoate--protein ligase family protein [Gemmataceae bacterium]